jgi:hypothetical protein
MNKNINKNNISSLLNNADYLLVDSLCAVEYCKNNGLKSSTKILSFNPYLVLGLKDKIESPEKNISVNYYKNISDITKEFTKKIYDKVYNYSNDNSLAIYSSKFIISIQNLLNKTNLITNISKNLNLVIIYPDYSIEGLNNKVNGNIYELLDNEKNITSIKLKYKEIDQLQMGIDPVSNFWLRLNFEGINSLLFRLFLIICNKFSFLWPGKRILFSHENTLLKGTASYLFRKGFFIEKISGNINYKDLYEKNILDKICNIITPIIIQYQEKIISQEISKESKLFILELLNRHISDYLNAKNFWEEYYLINKNNNIAACLIGTPISAMELSCIEVSKKHGIVTASFQHGVSKEISEDLLSIDVLYESSLVDRYFVFNNKAAEDSKNSRFNISKESVVGLAEDMKKGLTKQKLNSSDYPILYASTTLYCGNRGIPGRSGNSDLNKANFEIFLINNILSKVSSRIHYKPYFSKRFVGSSLENELVNTKNNMYLNTDEVDLRYIVSNFRVIITSRATSTLGWCVLSGKPVVYIENEDNRLKKEVVNDFKNNLFYFDILEKDWSKNLYSFLDQSINKIEEQWKLKKLHQEVFIEKYFGSKNNNAEKTCASILFNDILNVNQN